MSAAAAPPRCSWPRSQPRGLPAPRSPRPRRSPAGAGRTRQPRRPPGTARNGLQFPRVYGCLIGGSRTVSLGGGGRVQAVLLTLAGRFAGYGLRRTGVDTGSSRVRVVDLRSGRVIEDTAATTRVT